MMYIIDGSLGSNYVRTEVLHSELRNHINYYCSVDLRVFKSSEESKLPLMKD